MKWNKHLIMGGLCITLSGFFTLFVFLIIYIEPPSQLNSKFLSTMGLLSAIFLTLGGLFLSSFFDFSSKD